MRDTPLAVLIVDDSALMRKFVSKMVESDSELCVFDIAMNGAFALQKMAQKYPDVIVLDLEMPVMDGLTFLREFRKQRTGIPVIILSSLATRGAQATMEALSLGAADFVTKPSGSISLDIESIQQTLISKIKAYGNNYRERQGKNGVSSFHAMEEPLTLDTSLETKEESFLEIPPYLSWPKRTPKRGNGKIEIVVLGISTGGPNALRIILPQVRADLEVPLVIVQHMPEKFTYEFALSLDSICPLKVKEAKDGNEMKGGEIYIAPGSFQLSVQRKGPNEALAIVKKDPPVNGHSPSVDVLFRSVANEYKNNSLAILMTGMGRDGAYFLGSIYEEGGTTIAQDEATSTIYGMPRAAIDRGYAQRILPLEGMASVINTLVSHEI